ncbi:NRDE family protein [Fulvivirga lutea]|uniref:NRDE family protein n=1 Tax=Fulvivirga lutea TaxID=2810512 RepID=A0A974WG78_9BACT|nr:NRDE family protein [Fulvivirga lutea]QSE97711.1 NRDE family protein [Fulvivirga lutea]
MCLILFAKNVHPKYKLVLAANRDEFYERATEPATFWEDHEDLLAGKDLEAGGTWMGITKAGRIAMLTNYRDLSNIKTNAPSRGHLVTDYLLGEESAQNYLTHVESKGELYNGFNLIAGDADSLNYYGNYQKGVHKISDGLHGLSNALLDTSWPKVEKGKEKLESLLNETQINSNELLRILYDDIKANDNNLPETGVGYEKEKMLSPMFIKSSNYGSRCSTAILVTHDNEFTFVERTYDTMSFDHEDRKFVWKL